MSTATTCKFDPKFPQRVQEIREWEDLNLPQSQSRIAFDVLILIAHRETLQRPLTVKEIQNSLRYSERGVRLALRRLAKDGWCEVVGHRSDKRRKLVKATELLLETLYGYERHLISVYSHP